jgi:S-adenosylmethionine-diacylgycerolhomoserine-N-methlytransferase
MSIAHDLKILYHLALAPIRGKTHQERLESFYAQQAEDYDAFRARLLQGRRELYEALLTPQNGVWIEMGGGTGSNLEYLGPRVASLKEVHVVDLSPSLLRIAEKRIARHGWSNVHVHQADVTTFRPEAPADVITFSYSLTMIPDWFAALENAARLLKPGGTLGVVDFFVARKFPPEGFRRHGWWTRTFWPMWFALDNVHLNPDHVPYLHQHFEPMQFQEDAAKVPYLPLMRVPIYRFIGRKPFSAVVESPVTGAIAADNELCGADFTYVRRK